MLLQLCCTFLLLSSVITNCCVDISRRVASSCCDDVTFGTSKVALNSSHSRHFAYLTQCSLGLRTGKKKKKKYIKIICAIASEAK
jgi:hypothetical protein